jgi:hypothetical protein
MALAQKFGLRAVHGGVMYAVRLLCGAIALKLPYSFGWPRTLHGRTTAQAAEFPAMPPQLTDYELETAARACRALAHREQQSAEQISDPALRGRVQNRAECAEALAERFEKARRRSGRP